MLIQMKKKDTIKFSKLMSKYVSSKEYTWNRILRWVRLVGQIYTRLNFLIESAQKILFCFHIFFVFLRWLPIFETNDYPSWASK